MTGLGWPAVHSACRCLLGIGFVEASRLTGAPKTAVYRVHLLPRRRSSVIVKLYAGRARGKAAQEQQAFTLLAAAGCAAFSVPEVLACGPVPGEDVTALILDDLGPSSLTEAIRTGTCSRGTALTVLGRLLAALHSLPCPPAGPQYGIPRLDLAGQVTELRQQLPRELRAAMSETLNRVVDLADGRPLVWCHGDLHTGNVLLGPAGDVQGPHLIDFEQTALAAAEYDVAQTIATADAFDSADRNLLAAGYGPGLSSDLLAALVPFQVLRGLRWAVLRENRDASLWRARMNRTLDQRAGRS